MKILLFNISKNHNDLFESRPKEYCLEDNNLIYSATNSQGKTTLLRALLYSLGYVIPATRGIKFDDYKFILKIENNGLKYTLVRNGNSVEYSDESGEKDIITYYLPNMIDELHKKIFGIDNFDIVHNLLGCFYIDQEKGWTLLNRGKVIGSIQFTIEDLLLGLTNRSCDDLKTEIKSLEQEKTRYESMKSVADYKNQIRNKDSNIIDTNELDDLYNKISELELRKTPFVAELNKVNKSLGENKKFTKYLSDMKLFVKNPIDNNKSIPVEEKTLVGFDDSQEYLKTRARLIGSELSVIDNEIKIINKKIKDLNNRLGIKFETIADIFDQNIEKIHIDQQSVEKVLNQLKRNLTIKKKQKSDYVKKDNDALEAIFSTAKKFANEFGLEEKFFKTDKKEILSNDLKTLSGAKFSVLIFCYRMAFINEISIRTDIKLPIIIDSPHGKEIDDTNVSTMMKVLNENFGEHQIIIASINNQYEHIKFEEIEMNGRALDYD